MQFSPRYFFRRLNVLMNGLLSLIIIYGVSTLKIRFITKLVVVVSISLKPIIKLFRNQDIDKCVQNTLNLVLRIESIVCRSNLKDTILDEIRLQIFLVTVHSKTNL